MSIFVARVYVTLKPTVNDPQGLAIRGGLHHLGFESVESVRMGKFLELRIEAGSKGAAEEQADAMCRQLLANPVIEQYRFDTEPVSLGDGDELTEAGTRRG